VINVLNLVPSSNYTVRVRNKNSSGVSAWVSVSFSTPVDYPTPVAPQNLRVINVTATTVTVQWDFDFTGGFSPSYKYTVNGGPEIGTLQGCSPYCSGTDLSTATFVRPAPGATTRFSVTATSSFGKVSAPSVLNVTY
jgi:hypothetical protein